jgi:hypothetical protein
VTAVTDDAPAPPQTGATDKVVGNLQEALSMTRNEGNLDRAARVVIGLLLIGLAASGTVGAWGWIGVVPVLTGALGMCPLYTVLGINTCPMKAS